MKKHLHYCPRNSFNTVVKHFFSIISLSFLCFICTGCEKLFESDIEDDFNSLTDAEWNEEIRGTWKVIGACKNASAPVIDGKEYHIPHTYPTKLSHIVTTADSMKFVYNSPVTLIIQVPSLIEKGQVLNWQDGPSFNVTEFSVAYKGSSIWNLQGAIMGSAPTIDEESWRKYTNDWMAYFHGAEFGGSQEEIKKFTEAQMLYEPVQGFRTNFFSKDDEHACRLFLSIGSITYEMVR